MNILYFAWVREAIGKAAEEVDPPVEVTTVTTLVAWLAAQSPAHAATFDDVRRLRVAIDQKFASFDASIEGAREVAFFPPVTGG